MKPLIVAISLLLPAAAFADSITTVILVRHAEKVTETRADDMPLSELGTARAKELARVLSATPIDAIYTTQWLRTRQTAEPLAKALGIESAVAPSGKKYAADLAERIRDGHRGQTVLIIGHSNTTPEVMRLLGIPDPPPIPDSQYDDLFVCTLTEKSAKVVALKYGVEKR